jgi:hypothetical protein
MRLSLVLSEIQLLFHVWTCMHMLFFVAGALNDPASVARQAGSPQHLEGREARGLLEEELDKELAAIYHTAAFLPDNFKLVDACPHLTFTVEAQSSQVGVSCIQKTVMPNGEGERSCRCGSL